MRTSSCMRLRLTDNKNLRLKYTLIEKDVDIFTYFSGIGPNSNRQDSIFHALKYKKVGYYIKCVSHNVKVCL